MRIRTALIAALLLGGMAPLAGFTWSTYDHAVKRELADVSDRHLLLAKNLSAALSRYEKDVRATVGAIAKGLRNDRGFISPDLMEALHIGAVAIFDPQTGALTASVNRPGANHAVPTPAQVLQAVATFRGTGRTAERATGLTFTPVRREAKGNRIHVMGWVDGAFVIACTDTGYFQALGSQIAFGEMGHAAIVDQTGRVLSHPRADWMDSARDLSGLAPVRRMMNGETGVERFHTPALGVDVIAGLTAVAGPGWGVMIPQPVSELHDRALAHLTPFLVGFGVLFVIALLLTRQAIRHVATPLEGMASELKRQIVAGLPSPVAPLKPHRDLHELVEVVDAYNTLAATAQRSAQTMVERALQDPVTGIGNRSYFMEKGGAQIGQRLAISRRGMLIFIDLDGFKEINDTRGHGHGDAVLKAFAAQLYSTTKRFMDREFRGVTGAHPIIGRIGGDEFAILLPLLNETEDIAELGERLRAALPNEVVVDGQRLVFGTSAGGALYPEHGTQIDDLLRRADVALYSAKVEGRGRFRLYTADNALGGKSEIMQAVAQAIAENELELHYQPKQCLRAGRATAVEALVRWQHPQMGMVPPGMFLPAIQKTQVMLALGEWAIARAIADMQALDAEGHELDVAVNIGTEHFCAPGFTRMLTETCRKAGFDPARLQVEVTEDVAGHNATSITSTVERVQEAGFTVAIDDFGKGFSNLSRLAAFPADTLKLDRSLTVGATEDERIHALLRTAVTMGHALGSQVVIEGVETAEEVALATAAGADALQGYFIARPMPRDALAGWLDEAVACPQHRLVDDLRAGMAA